MRGCFRTDGTPLPLNFTDEARTSKLFASMPAPLFGALARHDLTENSHTSGIAPDKFVENQRLKDFFHVLSTNEDPVTGRQFASTIEAKHLPISGTQWHPEKNNFEWGKIGKLGYTALPHSPDAVLVSQHFANDFVSRARQSSHRFKSADVESRTLIYNFPAIPDPQGYFAQVYLWGGSRYESDQSITPSVMV